VQVVIKGRGTVIKKKGSHNDVGKEILKRKGGKKKLSKKLRLKKRAKGTVFLWLPTPARVAEGITGRGLPEGGENGGGVGN